MYLVFGSSKIVDTKCYTSRVTSPALLLHHIKMLLVQISTNWQMWQNKKKCKSHTLTLEIAYGNFWNGSKLLSKSCKPILNWWWCDWITRNRKECKKEIMITYIEKCFREKASQLFAFYGSLSKLDRPKCIIYCFDKCFFG